MEATSWKFLPSAGGLLDQDEMLMQNVFKIANVARKLQDKNNA